MASSGLNFSNLEIFSAKHLQRQIFPKLTFEILSKTGPITKTVIFKTLALKYAMQKPQIPKYLFTLAILPHRLEERKSVEKFRVSPLARKIRANFARTHETRKFWRGRCDVGVRTAA